MAKYKQKRMLWADAMRVVAIYFVIAVHTSVSPSNLLDTKNSFFFLVSFTVVKVCVPLFVMLSGALLLRKQESIPSFFSKRATKVLIPWVLWTLIYMMWNHTVHSYHPANLSQWKYFFELTFFSQLWFLPLIFSLYLVTPILRHFIPSMSKNQRLYLMALWFLFVIIIPFFHTGTTFPRAEESGLVPVTFYYSGYFILGYFLSTMKLPKNMVRRSVGLLLIGIAITFIELGLSKGPYLFDYFAPGIVVSSIGVFLLIFSGCKKYTRDNRWKKLVSSIGSASLGIYILHGLVAEIIRPIFPLLADTGYFFALVLFGISYLFVAILRKLPVLKILVP